MSWYECPNCGRELTEEQAYEGCCKRCGPVAVRLCGKHPDLPVNLNTATALELQRIAGFGKKTAECVVLRRESKKFEDVSELRKVRGVGKTTYEKVKDKVCVHTELRRPERESVATAEEDEEEWQLYTKMHGDVAVEYQYGPSWKAWQLLVDGGYKTPEEAKLAWLREWESQK